MLDIMLDFERFKGQSIRRLHADEYEQLIAAGRFDNEHVELIEGVILEMSPQGDPHVDVTQRIVHVLTTPVGDTYKTIDSVDRTGTLQPIGLSGVSIAVDELFRPD